MIKIYSMESCPDCAYIKEQIRGNDRYQVIDIGEQVRSLKEFLKLRDKSPVFNDVKKKGAVGIPCFILEDGTITLEPEMAGLKSRLLPNGAACNLDGSGC